MPTESADRPNILWVCTDSQRWDAVGCYGNRFVRTPAADALSAAGVTFEHCHAQNPLCMPSRGSFLTGRYPSATKLRANGQAQPPDLLPVTKRLADAGYVCGLAGKLHLSHCDRRFALGDWWDRDRTEWLSPGEARGDDGYTTFDWDHAPGQQNPHSAYTQWLADKGLKYEATPRADCRWVSGGMQAEHSQAAFCAEKAIDFLTEHEGSPWLFSLNCFDPHYGFDPPAAYLERYLDRLDDVPLPAYVPGELDGKPAPQLKKHRGGAYPWCEMTDRDHRMVRAAYWAMCDLIDDQLARVLAALDATGQAGNTLVIFTSDHGELLGDHGIYTKGPFLYDPALRVPLILRWPGVLPAGRRVAGLAELGQLAPTVAEAAGLGVPAAMQMPSLLPLARGDLERGLDSVYCEYLESNPDDPPVRMTAVRTATHKLIAHHGGMTGGELYDLAADPGEHRNLFDDPAHADVKCALLQRLAARMAHAMTDPLPEKLGVF